MITPNKAVPIKDSSLYKMFYILELDFTAITVSDLYSKVESKFDGIADFLYALDVLFVLSKVDFDASSGILFKC